MDPSLFLSGGAGGLSASSSADSRTGPLSMGGFHFAPKSSPIPPIAWVALAVVAVLYLVKRKG